MVSSFVSFLNDLLFTLSWPVPLVFIAGFMAFIAVLAYTLKHLTFSGAFAAWISGVSVLWILRFEGFFLFLVFYVSCNLTGLLNKKDSIAEKGSCRDNIQVLANGLVAVLMGYCWFFTGKQAFIVAFGAAVAESASDTWAGDFGRLWPYQPLSLKDFRPVEKGTSGAVSPLGCLAAVGASGFIAFMWTVLFNVSSGWGVIMLSGFFGCVLDSVLGAFCQALYIDDSGKYTEKPTGTLVRGLRWIDNDTVNFISNLCATLLAFILSKGLIL